VNDEVATDAVDVAGYEQWPYEVAYERVVRADNVVDPSERPDPDQV
jgi:hypothetical protein